MFFLFKVDIKIAPEEVAPGENVNLIITSKPNSYVGLLGVDQRAILLKSGNDISYVSNLISNICQYKSCYNEK